MRLIPKIVRDISLVEWMIIIGVISAIYFLIVAPQYKSMRIAYECANSKNDLKSFAVEQGRRFDKTGRYAKSLEALPGFRPSKNVSIIIEKTNNDSYVTKAVNPECKKLVNWFYGDLAVEYRRDSAAMDLIKYVTAGDTRKVSELLDNGADINHRNWANDTPLMVSIESGRIESLRPDMVKLLLLRGADDNGAKPSFTPFDVALLYKRDGIIPTLKEAVGVLGKKPD